MSLTTLLFYIYSEYCLLGHLLLWRKANLGVRLKRTSCRDVLSKNNYKKIRKIRKKQALHQCS